MYLNHYFCAYKMKSESGVSLWAFCLLRLLERLGAMDCFACVTSPEYWWVCYKSSQQLQESWDCDAAVAEQSKERCSVPKNLLPGGGYLVCVCVYVSEKI